MKNIISAIAIDGKLVEGSDYHFEYPFLKLIDFKEDSLSISNYYKFHTSDSRNFIISIPYNEMSDIYLRVIRRIDEQGDTSSKKHYNLEIEINNNHDVWFIETSCMYQLKEGLDRIKCYTNIDDVVGVFDKFSSCKDFYDLTDNEIENHVQSIVHRTSNRNDIQKYCDDNYSNWIDKHHFTDARIGYPELAYFDEQNEDLS